MTVREMAEALNLESIAVSDGERIVSGGYAGDLLSWVMGRAQQGDAWVTIMTNPNIRCGRVACRCFLHCTCRRCSPG